MTKDQEMVRARHWIDGGWVEGGAVAESVDPATGSAIGHYALAGVAEAEAVVNAVKATFTRTSWEDARRLRARMLNRLAELFEARTEDLMRLLGRENGKVAAHARLDVGIVPDTLRFNAALALIEAGRAAERVPGQLSVMLRQPAGVAGFIVPWNSPVALVVRSLAPALAAGCTAAVMLPAQTAQVNAFIAEIIVDAEELPRGVVKLITGGREAGNALVVSPDVPVISFTASTATGRDIAANAAARVKRLGLELGGKTPMIVFDDADLGAVVPVLVDALTLCAGQFCMTGSRLLVQHGIADRLRDALAARLEAVRVGPAADSASEMGPLIDQANVRRVDRMVEEAIAAGARAVVRGGPAAEGVLAQGAVFRPTLLEVVDPALPVVQQEVFEPVLTLQRFGTEAEAVSLANGTEYGLAVSVWSRDADRPLRIAWMLDAGTVWINGWAALSDRFEEDGFEQSGQGWMRGLAVLDDFLEYKHVAFVPVAGGVA